MDRTLLKNNPESADEETLKLLKIDAKQGLEDLYHFDKYILGYSEMEERVHRPLCEFLHTGKKKKLIMMPRGSFKSSVVTVGMSLQEMVLDPNIRILIANENLSNAQKFLGEIKGHITQNEYFRLLYGKLDKSRDDAVWNQGEIVISTRTKNLKEPTIATAGVDVTKVSQHYDLIIADDPVSKNNVGTRDQIEKVLDWYKLLLSLLEPNGRLVIIGTRWDYGDLYGTLMEPPHSDSFDFYIRQAEWVNEETGLKEYLFPERLSSEFLAEIKALQGTYVFSCTPGDAGVLMGDFSSKPIRDVRVGDEVMGYTIGSSKQRGVLQKTIVSETNHRVSPVQKVYLDSGDVIRCTPDHQWYTGRANGDATHRKYAPVKVGSTMIRALNGWTEPTLAERLDWRYLAGIIDGEGSCRHQGSITIHQSKEKNPSVYAEIKSVLGRLAIPYREYLYKYKACSSFHLEGGRSMKAKLLKYGTPAKKDQILAGLLTHTSRVGLSRDKVIRIEGDSVETVYALTTGTGNYISQGYASKNCQYQNSPVSAVDATFRPEWFKYYIDDDLKNIELNYFLTLDPAISLEKSADFTVFMICALDTVNNLYIIKIDRGKYLPDEIIKRLFEYNKRYRLCTNGIEVVAFQKTLRYQINDEMRKRNHFISVTELKHNSTVSKENRIIALQPRYEQGAIFHRQGDDMTTELESELIHFPRSKHDDISDTLASQLEIAFQPIQRKEKEKKKNKKKNKYASW